DILFNALVYMKLNRIHFNPKAYYHYFNRPVITLMKKFHENSFELKKWKNTVLEDFFEEWNISNRKELLSHLLIQGIRYCIHNLFSYKNQLSFSQKVEFIKKMYQDEMTKRIIKDFHPKGINAKIYKFLIKNRMAHTSAFMAKMIK